MKKIILLTVITLLAGADLFGQTVAKKYLLLEHFTNTRCGICGNRNPAFFETIQQTQNVGEVHHIAYHPRVPYPNCLLYQHNTEDNTGRADVYGIPGTPRLFIDGTQNSPSSPLVTQSRLDGLYGQTAPIRLAVEETANGNSSRDVQINVQSFEALTGGDLRLFVAVVEKKLDYSAPNGEREHFDVMRQMLPDANGIAFTPAAIGETTTLELNYALDEEWVADQMYVVAFVQDMATKEVINSGTPFDLIVDATMVHQACPNATNAEIALETSGGVGALSYAWSNGAATPTLSGIAAGTYTVTITDTENRSMVQNYTIDVVEEGPSIASVDSTPDTDAQADGTATVIAEGCSDFSYQWSDGQTTATATNLTAGEYTVTVTDCNGCTTESAVIVDQMITGVEDGFLANTITVTPNPATDWVQVNIQLPNAAATQTANLQLINTAGQVIKQLTANNQQVMNMNVADYPAGLYYIQLDIDGQKVVKKLTIVR